MLSSAPEQKPPLGGFFCAQERPLEVDFRVRLRLSAADIIKIMHAITMERVVLAALPLLSGCVIAMLA